VDEIKRGKPCERRRIAIGIVFGVVEMHQQFSSSRGIPFKSK
jgi:hypothetical protein